MNMTGLWPRTDKSKRWVTSDWHLGEDRMDLMMRPFLTTAEFMSTLIERHNERVSPDDLVIVVGDAVNQKKPEYLPYLDELNGRKILIRGNHDKPFSDEVLSQYFELIIPEGEGLQVDVMIDGKMVSFWATHYPSQARPDMFNLVGHVHSAWKFQLNSINVGIDCNHLYPHDIDVFVPFAYNAITKFYDQDVWAAYFVANQAYLGKRGADGTYFKKA